MRGEERILVELGSEGCEFSDDRFVDEAVTTLSVNASGDADGEGDELGEERRAEGARVGDEVGAVLDFGRDCGFDH